MGCSLQKGEYMKEELKIEIKDVPLTIIQNVTYAQKPYWFPFFDYKDLKMDIITSFKKPSDTEKKPLLVWLCGGAFKTMERAAFIPWLTNFAKKGFVVATVEYRLSNCSTMSDRIKDVRDAIRYLRAHSEMYGIDKERVVIGGESAGGMLSSLVAASNGMKEYDTENNLDESSDVSAVIDFYGPYTLLHDRKGENNDIDVPKFSLDNMPPVFLAQGTKDELIDPKYSDSYYEELSYYGIYTEYYLVKDAPHMGMEFYQDEMFEKIMDFLHKTKMC